MLEVFWHMSDKIGVGILGCANIADRFVIPAFQSSSQFEVIGIASRCQNTAGKFAQKVLYTGI